MPWSVDRVNLSRTPELPLAGFSKIPTRVTLASPEGRNSLHPRLLLARQVTIELALSLTEQPIGVGPSRLSPTFHQLEEASGSLLYQLAQGRSSLLNDNLQGFGQDHRPTLPLCLLFITGSSSATTKQEGLVAIQLSLAKTTQGTLDRPLWIIGQVTEPLIGSPKQPPNLNRIPTHLKCSQRLASWLFANGLPVNQGNLPRPQLENLDQRPGLLRQGDVVLLLPSEPSPPQATAA